MDFQQVFRKDNESGRYPIDTVVVDMTVREEESTQADWSSGSGRQHAHVSIELKNARESVEPESISNDTQSRAPQNNAMASFLDSALSPSAAVPVDRVILDNGTVAPIQEYAAELGNAASVLFHRTDYHDGIAHLQEIVQPGEDDTTSEPAGSKIDKWRTEKLAPGTYITIQIPEKTNLVCQLQSGSITVKNKVEGDVHLSTGHGDIRVQKLRGHTIQLHNHTPTTGGSFQRRRHAQIHVSQLLEAQSISVSTRGRFRAKQLHGNSISIAVDHRQNVDDAATTTSHLPNMSEVDTAPEHSNTTDDSDDEGSLVDISSLFVSGGGDGGATVTVHGFGDLVPTTSPLMSTRQQQQQRRAVRIKSNHGAVKVSTTHGACPIEINPHTNTVYPLVELGGVNGSCEVSIERTIQCPDRLEATGEDWASCLVHVDVLSPDSVSLITADVGNVAVTMDRKAESDVRLVSLLDSDCLIETGALLADEEDPLMLSQVLHHLPISLNEQRKVNRKDDRILIKTTSFTERSNNSICTDHITYKDGWVDNKSDEPDSRFDRKIRGSDERRGAGKIRHESAQSQALNSFSDQQQVDPSMQKAGHDDKQRPLLAVAGTGRITLETVSWLGAIARRYGLDSSSTDRELGRTASRRGRTMATPTE